jgi:hypothetical protein
MDTPLDSEASFEAGAEPEARLDLLRHESAVNGCQRFPPLVAMVKNVIGILTGI